MYEHELCVRSSRHCFEVSAYLNEHDVIVECLVVKVVQKYPGDIKNLFEAFFSLQVVFA